MFRIEGFSQGKKCVRLDIGIEITLARGKSELEEIKKKEKKRSTYVFYMSERVDYGEVEVSDLVELLHGLAKEKIRKMNLPEDTRIDISEESLLKLSGNTFKTLPVVLNKSYHIPTDSTVYIGRGSKYGNKFSHLESGKAEVQVGTRDIAVDKHKEWFDSLPEDEKLKVREELKDKDLMCFCKPARCHGDHLLLWANS